VQGVIVKKILAAVVSINNLDVASVRPKAQSEQALCANFLQPYGTIANPTPAGSLLERGKPPAAPLPPPIFPLR
jgi:hypothetical protein